MESSQETIKRLQAENDELRCELDGIHKIVQIGKDWERAFARHVNALGMPCQDYTAQHLPYDYIVYNHKIQCKITLVRASSADIRTRGSRKLICNHGIRCRYNVGDFDYLAMKNAYGDIFIVPSSILHDPIVPGSLVSRLHWNSVQPYKDNWPLLRTGGRSRCTCSGDFPDMSCEVHTIF